MASSYVETFQNPADEVAAVQDEVHLASRLLLSLGSHEATAQIRRFQSRASPPTLFSCKSLQMVEFLQVVIVFREGALNYIP